MSERPPNWWADQRRFPGAAPAARVPTHESFGPDEKEWIASKWAAIRLAQHKADLANSDWGRLNDEISEYIASMQITDPLQRAKVKGESLALKDALAVGNWHSRNAERHIHDLQLFLQMKQMGLL